MKKGIIQLGGTISSGRLYLEDLNFTMPDGQEVEIKKTDVPGIDMADLVARHKARYGLLALFIAPAIKSWIFRAGAVTGQNF